MAKSSRTRSRAASAALQRKLVALAVREGVTVDEVVVRLRRLHALADAAARAGDDPVARWYARALREAGLPAPARRPRSSSA